MRPLTKKREPGITNFKAIEELTTRYCLQCGYEGTMYPCPVDQSILMVRL